MLEFNSRQIECQGECYFYFLMLLIKTTYEGELPSQCLEFGPKKMVRQSIALVISGKLGVGVKKGHSTWMLEPWVLVIDLYFIYYKIT